MFSAELQKRLQLLDEHLVFMDDHRLLLEEKKTDGEARLILQLQNPCILFSKLEDKKLRYFKNQKCADYILYEWKENSWGMHIFELKRSVGFSSWEQIKEQAKGAMQNGLAIAGFLGIQVSLENTYLYSVYRNDKINDYANPGKLRYQMNKRDSTEYLREKCEWNSQKVKLNFLGEREFVHHKIALNLEDGEGSYAIA